MIASYPKNLLTWLQHYLTTEEKNLINISTPLQTEVNSQHVPNPLNFDIRSLPVDKKRILCNHNFESLTGRGAMSKNPLP